MHPFLTRLIKLAVLAGIVVAALYFSSEAFARRWRDFLIGQLSERGMHLDFRKLTIDPFRGIVARDIRLFNDEQHNHLIAAVDRINIGFDIGKLLDGHVEVNALTLVQTSVALPVDPKQPELTVVEVSNLNARLYLMDDRLDIRRAEGDLAGVRLSVTGSLILPERPPGPEQKKRSRENALKRLEFIHRNHQHVHDALRWLDRFQFSQKPSVTVNVSGQIDRLQDLHAQVAVTAGGLGYGGYVCEEIAAQAEYEAGLIDLTRLYLRDGMGVLDASATWQMGGDDVNFRLASTADLPSLASAFLSNDLLREVVFYEPSILSMDGTWHLKGPHAAGSRPFTVLGKVQCGRFASRGEVFDGLAANFGADPAGFYVRDGLLRHKTGTLGFQSMFRDQEGLKYRAVLKMDPHAFIPFTKQENTRELIRRFGFSDNSTILVQAEGSGPDMKLARARTWGRAELRDFRYRGVDFQSVEGDLEIAGPVQTFRNISVRRREGEGVAREVIIDTKAARVTLNGVMGQVDPVAVTNCFAPKTARHIALYKLPATTEVALAGVVGWKSPDANDLRISFRALGGTGHYALWGKDYVIANPVGELSLKQSLLGFDIKGSLFEHPMSAVGTVRLGNEPARYAVQFKAGSFPYPVFGEALPLEGLTAEVKAESDDVVFDVGSKLLGGTFSLSGRANLTKEANPYAGELKVENVSFKRFAQIYSPSNDTEGDLTGHFTFTGALNNWKALKGTGVGIILNGNLYAVPVIGPLTSLLSALLPGPIKGYNVAKEANCTFAVADGFVVTNDFEALTNTFRIVSKGSVDFIQDHVDFNAQVRVRGLAGVVLLPVSGLLEYKASGRFADPKWRPNPFGIVGGKKEGQREAPSTDELKTKEQAPADPQAGESDDGEARKRRRVLPFGLGGPK